MVSEEKEDALKFEPLIGFSIKKHSVDSVPRMYITLTFRGKYIGQLQVTDADMVKDLLPNMLDATHVMLIKGEK